MLCKDHLGATASGSSSQAHNTMPRYFNKTKTSKQYQLGQY